MSKILGHYKKYHNDVLKKFCMKDKDNTYFRLHCLECDADFIIKFSELRLCDDATDELDKTYYCDCPNCNHIFKLNMNTIFISNYWCDKNGNYMLNAGELYYIDDIQLMAFTRRDITEPYYEEVITSNEDINYDENVLCKTSDYNSIKEDDVHKTDEFNEDYENNSVFYMTHIEYIQLQNFHKVHNDCMINPDTGMHRFGAIGGGISVSYIISADGTRSVIAHCDYCNTTKNLSEDTETCLTAEEIMKIEDRYKHYHSYPDKMSNVEYFRYKKFCQDRPGETISVGFMGTGLGSLVTVKSETTGEYADITDIDSW